MGGRERGRKKEREARQGGYGRKEGRKEGRRSGPINHGGTSRRKERGRRNAERRRGRSSKVNLNGGFFSLLLSPSSWARDTFYTNKHACDRNCRLGGEGGSPRNDRGRGERRCACVAAEEEEEEDDVMDYEGGGRGGGKITGGNVI